MKIVKKKFRLWEIDLLRGLAVIGMVFYHLIIDLSLLARTNLNPFSFPFLLLARLIAIIFLFLVGFSFSFSLSRYKNQFALIKHTLKRSLKIFFFANLITVSTFFISPDFTVRFGILHLISLSLLLLLPLTLIPSPSILVFLASLFIIAGFIIPSSPLPSFDYFPIFPWFGIVILGYLFSKNYQSFRAKLRLPVSPHPLLFTFTFIGNHSLSIYLLHQPLLLLLLFLGNPKI